MCFYCKSSTKSHLHNSISFFLEFITLLILLPSPTNSISLNFPNFTSNDPRIRFEGDSIRNGSLIEVTRNNANLYGNLTGSVGRAAYSEAIQLWNENTGWQTDFDTHFSFIIDGPNRTHSGDGLAFFLAPFGSVLPPESAGGSLGLLSWNNTSRNNSARNRIVAVEFDSYKNEWDPSSDHVGINVNSVVSVATVLLENDAMSDGRRANAWVTYNSTTKYLSVYLTYDDDPVFNGSPTLSYIVDLSKVLPESITVGFAAATGSYFEIHQVLSWEFSSTVDKETGEGQTNSKGKGNKTGLAVGLGVGLGVLGCGLGFALFVWLKKRRSSRNLDEVGKQ